MPDSRFSRSEAVGSAAADHPWMRLQSKTAQAEVVSGTREVLFIKQVFHVHRDCPAISNLVPATQIEDIGLRRFEREAV